MRDWYTALTPAQRQALVQHKAYSEKIRRFLLGQPCLPAQSGEVQPSRSMIDALDEATAGWSLPSDATLYCGVEVGRLVSIRHTSQPHHAASWRSAASSKG